MNTKTIFSTVKSFLIVFFSAVCFIPVIHAQESIELIGAEVSEYDAAMVDAERLIGNVRFRQNNVYMDCDSAWFYHAENKIEAFGHIYIRQQDTLNLWGEYLLYNGDTKQAMVSKNVRMTDREMTLTTPQIHYDLTNKTAYYTSGGHIDNGKDRLYSRKGHYFSRSKEFHFKDSVRLVNPEYTMSSDTLWYNTISRKATFWGPTYINSEENSIFCRYGWYNTLKNTSEFSKGAWIAGKENKLWADSMLYNRNTGEGRAFRNILLMDTVEKVRIAGENGKYMRHLKTTWISGNPVAMKQLEDDTLYMIADTLMDLTDTATLSRSLSAYHQTQLYKRDMQGICDSLSYALSDSVIRMFYNPIIWNEQNQVSGDTLIIYRRNNRLDKLDVRQKAFVIMKDSLEYFNQVKGRNMTAFFEQNKIHHIDVFGNGQSIYYAREDDGSYTGVNEISCADMRIHTDSGKVNNIRFYTQPEGTFYPLDEFPEDNAQLPDFKWLEMLKPQYEQFEPYRNRLLKQR